MKNRPGVRYSFVAVAAIALLLLIAPLAMAAGKPPSDLEKRVAALEAQVAALAAVVSDLQAQLDATEARVAEVESNPVLNLGPFFSVTDETVAGEPGPNVIYDGPSWFQAAETPPGLTIHTRLLDFTGPATPYDVAAWYDTTYIWIDWSVPAGSDEEDRYYLYRAESPLGPWFVHRVVGDTIWRDDQFIRGRGQTFYYRVAAADYANAEKWGDYSANVSGMSEVVSVYVP